jgi:hypothetical protein
VGKPRDQKNYIWFIEGTILHKKLFIIAVISIFASSANAQAWRNCIPGSIRLGGCDSIGPGGGLSIGPSGGPSIGPGGGLSTSPGGSQSLGRDRTRGLNTQTMQSFNNFNGFGNNIWGN